MSGASQGFGEHGAFTISVACDLRLMETVHELTKKAAEMNGCGPGDAAGLADATLALTEALGGDVDLAYRPTPEALVLEVRPARRGSPSLQAVLADGDAFARIKALVPAAEVQGDGADACCALTCPRTDAPSS